MLLLVELSQSLRGFLNIFILLLTLFLDGLNLVVLVFHLSLELILQARDSISELLVVLG